MSQTAGLGSHPVTVLGVGNPIMGDDGAGLAILEALEEKCGDPRVEFVYGVTGGLELLPCVQDATRLLVLDAVAGSEPGQVVRLTGDQLPRLLSSKLSPHQVGLLDVFAAARLSGREPASVMVIGIVPESVEMSLTLSPVVARAVPAATDQAMEILNAWLEAL